MFGVIINKGDFAVEKQSQENRRPLADISSTTGVATKRYAPMDQTYLLSAYARLPVMESNRHAVLFGGQHAAFSFRGSIRVSERMLSIDAMGSCSLTSRPEGADLRFQLTATLSLSGQVLERKNFDRSSPIIVSSETLKTQTYVGRADFKLPDPVAALQLKLSGMCAAVESGGTYILMPILKKPEAEYLILVEDV